MRENTLAIGMAVGREDLRNRIEVRVDTMVDQGLEDEARKLAERYGWDCEPMKGIGLS